VRVCVWHRMSVPAPGVPDAPRGGVSPPDARNGSVHPRATESEQYLYRIPRRARARARAVTYSRSVPDRSLCELCAGTLWRRLSAYGGKYGPGGRT
jgi:hypothetical protein